MLTILIYALCGAAGGIVRTLITGKGIVILPRIIRLEGASPHLDLGCLAPAIIGAFAGVIAPAALGINGIVSACAGYAGADFVENLIERTLKK